jgi:hypothetical protein
MDTEFLEVLYKDLIFLFDEWDQEITPNSLRVSSPIIRRLLVESGGRGNVFKGWRLIGLPNEPIITFYENDEVIPEYPLDMWDSDVHEKLISEFAKYEQVPYYKLAEIIPERNKLWYVFTGGAKYKGMSVGGIRFYKGDAILDRKTGIRPRKVKEGLTKFVNAPCISVFGKVITRAELIRYVSNKIGGVHFDKGRDLSKEQDRKFVFLDICRQSLSFGTMDPEMDAVLFEILSVGQSLIKSKDIRKLADGISIAI